MDERQRYLEVELQVEQKATAYHEAGHVVIARHLGLSPEATLQFNDSPAAGDRNWEGRTDVPGDEQLSLEERRLLAAAGPVAHEIYLAECRSFDETAVLTGKHWSPADRAKYGSDPLADCKTLRTLVCKLRFLLERDFRSELDTEANRLLAAAGPACPTPVPKT